MYHCWVTRCELSLSLQPCRLLPGPACSTCLEMPTPAAGEGGKQQDRGFLHAAGWLGIPPALGSFQLPRLVLLLPIRKRWSDWICSGSKAWGLFIWVSPDVAHPVWAVKSREKAFKWWDSSKKVFFSNAPGVVGTAGLYRGLCTRGSPGVGSGW